MTKPSVNSMDKNELNACWDLELELGLTPDHVACTDQTTGAPLPVSRDYSGKDVGRLYLEGKASRLVPYHTKPASNDK